MRHYPLTDEGITTESDIYELPTSPEIEKELVKNVVTGQMSTNPDLNNSEDYEEIINSHSVFNRGGEDNAKKVCRPPLKNRR